jgi:hypothetical protein
LPRASSDQSALRYILSRADVFQLTGRVSGRVRDHM